MSQDKPVLSREQILAMARGLDDAIELLGPPEKDADVLYDAIGKLRDLALSALDRQYWVGVNFGDGTTRWIRPTPAQIIEPPQVAGLTSSAKAGTPCGSAQRSSEGNNAVAGPASGSPDNAGAQVSKDNVGPTVIVEENRPQPASPAPDISSLVKRLESAYSTVFERSLAKEAAQALRALEAERGTLMAYSDGRNTTLTPLGEIIDKMEKERIALQHEADRLRGWLGETLEIAEVAMRTDYGFNYHASIKPTERIAQIRKDAKISSE